MLDIASLVRDLDAIGLDSWREAVLPLIDERLSDKAHGDLPAWKAVVAGVPATGKESFACKDGRVVILAGADEVTDPSRLRAQLQQLIPWRKGPFRIGTIDLDTEWRSDLKWDRVCDAIAPLAGRNVLDVGCGNGYYAFRMKCAGATRVIGIDPTLLFVCQFHALRNLSGATSIHVLPLRLHDLPAQSVFDTTFSMGVLYHQRDPSAHLLQLRDTLRHGGQLVLETLVTPGDTPVALQGRDRYARMRNVWHLPTVSGLEGWLIDAGFDDVLVVDITRTSTDEQRTTAWMPYESLAESLDPDDASLTVEGLPAPTRVVVTALKP